MARESVKAGVQSGKEEGSGVLRAEDKATVPGSVVKTKKMSEGSIELARKGGVNTTSEAMANQPRVGSARYGKLDEDASSSSWMQMATEVKELQIAIDGTNEQGKKDAPSTSSAAVEAPRPSAAATSTMSKMGANVCDGWIKEMGQILQGATLTPGAEMARWKKPSIYRVPEWIKGSPSSSSSSRAYRPDVVSLGPIHHGASELRPMEEHKRRLMLHMVRRSGKPLKEYVGAVAEVAGELQNAYDGLGEEWRGGSNTDRFVNMMVTDGGFLLEIMTIRAQDILHDYDPTNDPIVGLHGLRFLKPRIRSDMCLVENQLPLLLLQKLEAVRRGECPNLTEIIHLVGTFLRGPHWEDIPLETLQRGNCNIQVQPLDVFHKSFCGGGFYPPQFQQEVSSNSETTMDSALEFWETGVNFKRSKTQSVQDIDFEDGVLSMPLLEVNHATEKIFRNLMAFEKLHWTKGNDATDYFIFMDNIIESERDVALLRSKGVLRNFLGSDKAVAELFNTLRKGADLNPWGKVSGVQGMMTAHCKKRRNKWRTSFMHTYLRNPWVFISLVAAVILLALTVLQAVYAVLPFYTKG
ncbi:hypothetical protein ACP70R_001826 [Stipagrostis hirtigluma subsp. patula]